MEKKEIKIVNLKQATKYIGSGVQPSRIEIGYGERLVFIFNNEETHDIWIKWKNREI